MPTSNSSVLLSWSAFMPGLDESYCVYRKPSSGGTWTRLNAESWEQTFYIDNTVSNGTSYDYAISVLDNSGFESHLSDSIAAIPQAFSFANELLVVDETRDGNGANINPNDAMVDSFYNDALLGLAAWDNWDCTSQGLPPLSVLGSYKLILWHADDFSQNLLQDNLANLSGYIIGGGKVVLSGWKTASILSPTFVQRFLGDVTLVYDNTASLISALPNGTMELPELAVDAAKTLPIWNNMLPYIYTFTGTTNSLYTANMNAGSAGNGNSIAMRFDNNGTLVMFGFPLYFMQAEGVRNLLQNLLPGLNPALPNADDAVPLKTASLAAYPNPFNPSTVISYNLPVAGAATLELFNLKGQKVKTLFSGIQLAGAHSVSYNGLDEDGRGVGSGVYLLRLKHPQGVINKKITMVK